MSKVWFITGATRGIGKEITLAALNSGEKVIATGRNLAALNETFNASKDSNDLLLANLDVTNELHIQQAVHDAVKRFGRIDVLINNAGYGQLGHFETLTKEQLEKQYRTNVFGVFNVTRAILPNMRKQRSGHILNLSSIGGVVGFGGCAAYISTKFAIEGFSEDLAIDLKPFGIHVTIIEPGFFRTDFLDNQSVQYGDLKISDYDEMVAAQQKQYNALSHKQLGDPAKLAKAILKIVECDTPPLRYAAGTDAVKMTVNTLEKRLAELEKWRSLSETTDAIDI